MRGRPAERYTTVREFEAIRNGLSYALGVAAARRQGGEGKIVLVEGDGGRDRDSAMVAERHDLGCNKGCDRVGKTV